MHHLPDIPQRIVTAVCGASRSPLIRSMRWKHDIRLPLSGTKACTVAVHASWLELELLARSFLVPGARAFRPGHGQDEGCGLKGFDRVTEILAQCDQLPRAYLLHPSIRANPHPSVQHLQG
jgi:hypothetical protein